MLSDSLVRDFRLAARRLRRSPLFTFATVATLAVGIGANTAMFSVVESVLWRPPAYFEPDRLVAFTERLSAADFIDIQRHARSFSAGSAGRPDGDQHDAQGRIANLSRSSVPGYGAFRILDAPFQELDGTSKLLDGTSSTQDGAFSGQNGASSVSAKALCARAEPPWGASESQLSQP